MKYASRLAVGVGVALVCAASASCSSTTPSGGGGTPDGGGDGGTPFGTPSVGCTDTIDAIYGNPGAIPPGAGDRGAILKCAKDADLGKDALAAELAKAGYTGKPLTSGAKVFRIAYATQRGDGAGTPAVSSAIVYIPDTPRAAKLPIVVAGRGSRGQAPSCAVSKFDPSQAGINEDAYRLVYPLVGFGYAVILTDLAGYANFGAPGNPPSVYAGAADQARSTLDSGRALKKLFPSDLDEKVVLVGHSQGGHSVLSSLAYVDSYGSAGPVVGTAVYAPLWFSQRAWGSVLIKSLSDQFPFSTSSAGAVAIWYHYTHAELLDGPGAGKKLFAADKADAIEAFVKGSCWENRNDALTKLGTTALDVFLPAFVNSVSRPAAGIQDCFDDATCKLWLQRYNDDRPKITTKTPILLAYGGKDTTIPPDRERCAIDKLSADGTNLTVCFEPDKDHGSILNARADYVADWIANVALGAPAPAACPAGKAAVTAECATPPPND